MPVNEFKCAIKCKLMHERIPVIRTFSRIMLRGFMQLNACLAIAYLKSQWNQRCSHNIPQIIYFHLLCWCIYVFPSQVGVTDRLICPLVIICSQHGMHGSVNAARKHSIANLKTRGSVCTADSESPKAKFMLWQNPNILLRRTSICVKNRKSVCVWGGGAFSRIEEGSDKSPAKRRAERRGEGDKVFSLKVCASFHFLGGVTVSCSSMEWEKQDGERLQCSTIPSFHPT